MTSGAAPVLELAGVSKHYQGLRPLRLEQLTVHAGDRVALLGFDRAAAEVFVSLVTGAALPDAGSVTLFGRPTSDITDSAEWLAIVDGVGIVSDRVVLLEALTVVQNLALPYTLAIEPPAEEVRRRAIDLAAEVGLAAAAWERPVADLDAAGHARVRLGRALALDPAVLLVEHISAGLDRPAARLLAADMRRLASARGTALVALTGDERFAAAVASRVMTLDPASGRLRRR